MLLDVDMQQDSGLDLPTDPRVGSRHRRYHDYLGGGCRHGQTAMHYGWSIT